MVDSFRERVVAGAIWALAQSWGGKLASFVIFSVLVRIVSPSEVGTVAAGVAVIALMDILIDQGLGDALVQKQQQNESHLNTVFIASIAVACLLAGVLWLSAPGIASAANIPELKEVLRALCFSLPITALGICPFSIMRRELQYRKLAIRYLASTVISGGLGISLAAFNYGVWSLVAQALCSSFLNTIIVWIGSPWRPSSKVSLDILRELYRYGLGVTSSRILHYLSTKSIEVLIGYFLGPVTLGIFSIAARVYQVMLQLLSSSLFDVSLSAFSAISTDVQRVRAAYFKGVGISALLATPTFIGVAALSTEICRVIFGDRWSGAGDVLCVLSLLGAIQSIEYHNVSILKALGRTDCDVWVNLAKAISTLTAFACSYRFGLVAVATSILISNVVTLPLSYYFLNAIAGISGRSVFLRIKGCIASCIIMFGVARGIALLPIMGTIGPTSALVILTTTSMVVYFILLRIFDKDQTDLAWTLLRRSTSTT